ncbi:hypothetical protein LCGC14_1135910 [marine sediment metagenome]|uniref:Uncharacterized protein n=1 Tax=marine sediment metagenome TaxID=412755 RepID=A0A0F9PHX6_9ZZZZ
MNQYCDACGSVLVYRTQPGMLDQLQCPKCTTTIVQLPANDLKAKRKAAVLEHYDEMPLLECEDGDTYYITSMNAICRWDAKEQDYQILDIADFKWPKPEDEFNNRRGAILAQRARKACGTS